MAATAAVPKKSASSAANQETGPRKTPGFLSLEHEFVKGMPLLVGPGGCSGWLTIRLMSLVNYRGAVLQNNGRPATGATGVVRVDDLVKEAEGIWEERQVRYALKEIAPSKDDKDHSYALFESMSIEAAMERELIAPLDKPTKRDLYAGICFLELRSAWPAVRAQRKKDARERREALKKREEDAVKDSGDQEEKVIPITKAPATGNIRFEPRVRARIQEMNVTNGSVSLTLRENVLECQICPLPVSASQAEEITPQYSAGCLGFPSGDSPVETAITPQYSAGCEGQPATETEAGTPQYSAGCLSENGHNGHQANGNGHIVTPTSPDFFSLNDYQDFCVVARQRIKTATNEELYEVVSLCRGEVTLAGIEPDWLTSAILIHGIRDKSVSRKDQHSVGFWIKRASGKKPPLLAIIGNWAQEFASTGQVVESNLTPEGERLVEQLERSRGLF